MRRRGGATWGPSPRSCPRGRGCRYSPSASGKLSMTLSDADLERAQPPVLCLARYAGNLRASSCQRSWGWHPGRRLLSLPPFTCPLAGPGGWHRAAAGPQDGALGLVPVPDAPQARSPSIFPSLPLIPKLLPEDNTAWAGASRSQDDGKATQDRAFLGTHHDPLSQGPLPSPKPLNPSAGCRWVLGDRTPWGGRKRRRRGLLPAPAAHRPRPPRPGRAGTPGRRCCGRGGLAGGPAGAAPAHPAAPRWSRCRRGSAL